TGCRLLELQNTNVGDVDWERGLRINRKGRSEPEYIPLENPILCAVLAEEIQKRGNPAPSEPLFLNRYGKRFKKIRHSLATACKAAGVPYTTHHGLRHAFANILRKKIIEAGSTPSDSSGTKTRRSP